MLPCSLLRRAPRALRRVPLSGVSGVLGPQQQVRMPSAVDFSGNNLPPDVDGDVFAPENVLSKENREACLRRLSRIPSLKPPSTRPKDDPKPREAGVLVPLCVVNGEVSLLFTLRSPHMSQHRGQVSFPGGMKDDEDDSYEATALRETEEELDIPRGRVDIWGRCPVLESAQRVTAIPVVGNLGEIDISELKFNPKEVGDVFTISLRNLCDREKFGYTQFRTGRGYSIPVFLGGKYRVWGLTAAMAHMFLTALLPTVYKNKIHYIKPLKL